MKKFMSDVEEIFKDLWNGFVWIVDFADELGTLLGERAGREKSVKVKLTYATVKVKRNCVVTQE